MNCYEVIQSKPAFLRRRRTAYHDTPWSSLGFLCYFGFCRADFGEARSSMIRKRSLLRRIGTGLVVTLDLRSNSIERLFDWQLLLRL